MSLVQWKGLFDIYGVRSRKAEKFFEVYFLWRARKTSDE